MELKRYKLGEILELQRGYDLPSSQQKAGNVLVAGSNGIIGYHNEIRGNHPCITVGRSGSVGKVHYYEQPTWAHNTALFVKDFKGNNPQYLYYFLKNLHLDEMFVKGSSVVPSLDRKVVHSLVVPFHKEVVCQKRIALVLSNIDRKIELNRAINQNLEAMAKQLYDYWFVQFDFPNEEGKPYKSSGGEMVWNEKLKRKIPNEWDNCKLKDFINLFDSKRIPLSSKDREERKGNYPYYGATGIMDYVNEYIFDGDYILLAEDGSTSDSKGFPIVQYIWGKNWVNNHAHIILPKNEQYLMFTYQMLRSIPAKQIETGSIQKKISQENLCEYNMVLPNSILIEKYESIISPLWEKRKLCIEEINALIKQRDELLPLLMNGQASVNSDLSDG
ncbi:restriction endonuclease subunit S [Bacteroides thetaiotaomicron]|uniref:Restriction endonuclease subunit S n=1 Tax=Bacteroides thetaiotaomicron TaxID=818 RepID=A0A6I0TCM6_BACT4|nr:restriction endonuclease subunit S [Bacteroides thetaiotaomicron]KAB4479499.1 restriction endonuclease subunit S [Bacteroides thetaiotaomicron]KAB4518434.1 restriction endonuclease subunit S [Bacteroides thetaiotaomicron]